nr:hypothetical protein [Clostridia bacterium]
MTYKGSLRSQLLRSFLLLLVPVILFAIVLFTYNLYRNEQYTNEITLGRFNNAVDDTLTVISQCERAAGDTALLEKCFQKVDGRTVANDANIFVLLEKVRQKLRRDIDVTLYIRGDESIYTGIEKLPYYVYERQFESTKPLSSVSFFSALLKTTSTRLFPTSEPDDPNGTIALLVPVSFKDSLGVEVLFTFWIKSTTITSIFSDHLGASMKDVYIYDSAVVRTYYISAGSAADIAKLRKPKGTGLIPVMLDGERHILLRTLDSERSLVFAMLAPIGWFYQTLRQTKAVQAGLLLALVLVIAGIASLMAGRNYAPIRALFKEITGEDANKARKNELDIIRWYYSASLEERDELEEQVSLLRDAVAEQFFDKVIQGQMQSAED